MATLAQHAAPQSAIVQTSDIREQVIRLVHQFFEGDSNIFEKVKELISIKKTRLILNIHEFDQINANLTKKLLNNPLVYLSGVEEAFKRFYDKILRESPDAFLARITPKIGITGYLGFHTVTPRGLTARLVNRLVCVEGIVTRCSLVHPKLTRSVLVADHSLFTITRVHHDPSSLLKDEELNPRPFPKTDNDKNPLKLEYGLCEYKDFQRITIQEMPESTPTGQLPRSVEVLLDEDVVDEVKPGDRILCWGVYRAHVMREGHRITGLSSSSLICNYVQQLRHTQLSPDISPMDIRFIKELAARPDTFDLLSRSVVPSICGHELVKKGLLLQLLGGERKELENAMKLRGDIHILLIGDPSCGKSQMLRFMLNISPLALSTTGRGSSGVGLTAAVATDRDTGERKLDAGALVLADGGLVCIDEFDKMSYEDRVAIHEVMEQQTVSISKAGIQTTLNARTSVLAAANPVYGTFDPEANLKSQISFPDSLLSRFDLIYIIRDAQTADDDRRICSQVLRQLQHKMESRGDASHSSTALVVPGNRAGDSDQAGVIQAGPDKRQCGSGTQSRGGDGKYWESSICPALVSGGRAHIEQVLSLDSLRKYIHYARWCCPAPVLGNDAIESISEFYANLRQICASRHDGKRSHVIPTARSLEACVRLATAHARLKLKPVVNAEDAEVVQQLLSYTLLGEVPKTEREFEQTDPEPDFRRVDIDGSGRPTRSRKRPRAPTDDVPEEEVVKLKRRQPVTATVPSTSVAVSSSIASSRRRTKAKGSQQPSTTGTTTTGLPATTSVERGSLSLTPALRPTGLLVGQTITEEDDEGGEHHQDDRYDDSASQGSVESVESVEHQRVMALITQKRLRLLVSTLSIIKNNLSSSNDPSIPEKELHQKVNEVVKGKSFTTSEFKSGLQRLQSESKIMIVHNEVWFI